jgi:murein DD-endopeptidase MepM/ murein hydrolase activator NlpD
VPSPDLLALARARSPQLVRLVLLAALGLPLGGLALTAQSAPAPVVAASVSVSDGEPALRLTPTIAAAPVRVVTPRATRTRSNAWVRPVPGGLTSPYGPRWGAWHPGLDFSARTGTPIRVVTDGTVIGGGYLPGESGYGKIVLVRHRGGVITAYAHMSRVLAHAGQRVHRGQVLGLAGSTGHVTGPHLHFEVRVAGQKVNPIPWLRRHGVRV